MVIAQCRDSVSVGPEQVEVLPDWENEHDWWTVGLPATPNGLEPMELPLTFYVQPHCSRFAWTLILILSATFRVQNARIGLPLADSLFSGHYAPETVIRSGGATNKNEAGLRYIACVCL